MPSPQSAGCPRDGTRRVVLAAVAIAALFALPAAAAAAPVGSASVHSKRASKHAGSALAFKAVASASAPVSRLHIYLDAKSTARHVELGLYRGASKPRSKVGSCAVAAPRAGWNSCTLAKSVRVTKSRTYWTALLLPRGVKGVVRFRDKRVRKATSYVSSSSRLRSLPSSYRPGRKWRSVRASMYADRIAGGGPQVTASPPDSDQDGIPDASDKCPGQAGPASNGGCPPGAAVPARSSNCMPAPSACGFPDMTNTGVLPGVARDSVSGTVTLSTPGQVYENKTVTGGIVVNAPNVTIRNVELHSRVFWGIRCRIADNTGCSNLLVQNSEIDLDGQQDVYGIIEDNYTLDHVQIHDGADCAHTGQNVVIKNSFCSLGTDADDDGWADASNVCQSGANGTPHYDGFQSDGGANLVFDHNTIRNPCSQTSAILMSTNVGPISNVTITNNLMAGGGYTVYCAAAAAGVGGTEVVTGNRIARTYRPQGGYYGPFAYCQTADTFSGNVWDDTGKTIGS